MSVLTIVRWHNPILRQKSFPVEPHAIHTTAEIPTLIRDMKDTLVKAKGLGLSAVQVGRLRKVIVAKTGDTDDTRVFINAEIVEYLGSRKPMMEGCLSIPGVMETVDRHLSVKVKYLDEQGKEQVETLNGLLAHVLQHEIEHTDGKLYVDRLPAGKKDEIRAKMTRALQRMPKNGFRERTVRGVR